MRNHDYGAVHEIGFLREPHLPVKNQQNRKKIYRQEFFLMIFEANRFHLNF